MIRLLPLAALSLALAACGSKPAQDTSEPDTSAPAESATVTGEAPMAAAAPASFNQCRACHSVEAGKHGVGPSLAGVYGTKAGEIPGFAFSEALKKSGLTWDDATLDKWLESPMKLVPGTRMVYAGQADPAKRAELVAYIKSLK